VSKLTTNFSLLRPAAGLALLVLLGGTQIHAAVGASAGDSTSRLEAGAASETSDTGVAAMDKNVLTRKGVRVQFTAAPIDDGDPGQAALREGDYADIRFQITGADDDTPVQGNSPGVWLDLAKAWSGRGTGSMACKDRVALYLQGTVGMRPMVDLNSYFILVMNRSPSISVIDPFVGITGITNLYAQINLERPPADWVKTRDQRRLFVSMPLAGRVAVVDLLTFEVADTVDVGANPIRVALQRDGRYLWVASDAKRGEPGGVTVVDTDTLKAIAYIPTGRGHHELAFSADDGYAFVSNRDDGTVSVIDIRELRMVKNIPLGQVPISLAFSSLSQSLYVADGQTGTVSVIGGEDHELVAKVETKPGLGPLRITEDGRFALVVNTAEDVVYVIDAATNQLKHTIEVGDEPYQISFSRDFAYVRGLATERVSMIYIPDLPRERTPAVVSFPAGAKAPKLAGDVSIADGMMASGNEAAALVVSPADATVYYYIEGMNAPMGAFRNYGQQPRAVTIADRSLTETEPGVYTAKVKLPAAGTFDVAFLLETPEVLHCFSMAVAPDPDRAPVTGPIGVEYLERKHIVKTRETHRLRFRLTDPADGDSQPNIKDVSVLYYRAPSYNRTVVAAVETEPGIYEAALPIPHAGAYYAYIGVPSRAVKYGDIAFITLRTERQRASNVAARAFGAAAGSGRVAPQ